MLPPCLKGFPNEDRPADLPLMKRFDFLWVARLTLYKLNNFYILISYH